MPSKRTVPENGERQVHRLTMGNTHNMHCHVVLYSTWIPPFLLFKRKTITMKEKFPPKVNVRVNKKVFSLFLTMKLSLYMVSFWAD